MTDSFDINISQLHISIVSHKPPLTLIHLLICILEREIILGGCISGLELLKLFIISFIICNIFIECEV